VISVLALEPQAERVLQGAAQGRQGLHVAGILDPLQRGAGVGSQEPGEVGGVAQWRVAQQRSFKVIVEIGAPGVVCVLRVECPERGFVIGQREALPRLRLAAGVEADNQEVAVRADQHLAVAFQVAKDLGRARHPGHVLRRPLDFHHAALGRAGQERVIAGLGHRLARHEQAAIRDPCPAVPRRQDTGHRWRERRADLVQQLHERAIVGGLRSSLASRVNGAKAFKVSP